MTAVVKEYWHPSNGDLGRLGVVNTSEEQYKFFCTCKLHTHTITVWSLVSGHPWGIECKICAALADSQLELVVRGAVQQLGLAYQVYPKILRRTFGAADLYIELEGLIVQVDGPQHVAEDCKSVPNAVQRERDAAFNAEALRQGRSVLRLHHIDVEAGDSHRYIKWAVIFSQRRPELCFLMYSKRYRSLGCQPVFMCKHSP